MADDDQGEWLNVTRAAHRLGWPRERLRSLVRRGKLQTMRGNTGELLVLVTPGLSGQAMVGYSQPPWLVEASPAHLVSQPPGQPEEMAKLRDDLERWRATAEERGMALAKAEGENAMLREALDVERDRTRRLEDEIRELRRPWWRRLLGS
jgi:hypothetical protein